MPILDFNGLSSGDTVSDQFAALGVTISGAGNDTRPGGGDAMIFDTAAVTGGDDDLGYEGRGGALIISEDGDSSDADDNADGGVLTFDFAAPSDVDGLTVLDANHGGVIRAFDANGALIGVFDVPNVAENGAAALSLPFTGVSRLEVELFGGGALDDLSFEPSPVAAAFASAPASTQTVLTFDGLTSGDVVDDEFADLGVTISGSGVNTRPGGGDAMIFDTASVTGGDDDLGYEGRGGALIVSEDGDSSDADDNRDGGVLTFNFDAPADVDSLTFLDGEEGGEVRGFDADGNLVGTVALPPGVNNGATDVAIGLAGVSRLEVELNGSGAIDNLAFSQVGQTPTPTPPPPESDSETVTLPGGAEVTGEIETPGAVSDTESTLSGSFTIGGGAADNNVVFIVDVSGSTFGSFAGALNVGDRNGDGFENTILDAEIAALQGLSDAIAGLGIPDANLEVGLIEFDSFASLVGGFEAGSTELSDALAALSSGGGTSFPPPLQQAITFLTNENAQDENNIVYFLSDGFGFGNTSFQIETLEDEFGASIVAVGVGNGSSLAQLDQIDNTGGAEIVTSPEALQDELFDPAFGAELDDFIVFVNGVEQEDIDIDDLTETPFGFTLDPVSIGDLDPTEGFVNSVEAVLSFDDGSSISLEVNPVGDGFMIV